jgi:hypothetical protein
MLEPYDVTVDGMGSDYVNNVLFDNSSHHWIYVLYSQSPSDITITPEFSSTGILILLMSAAFFVACVTGIFGQHLFEVRRKRSGQVGRESSSKD